MSWLRTFHSRPRARVRLVCLPYAGGGAGLYRTLAQRLGPGIEVVAVQYPGRQDRRAEAPVDDLEVLAERIAQELSLLDGPPVALFGHSLGATVGFEVARRMLPRFPSPVTRLFVSARIAPADHRPSGRDFREDAVLRAWARGAGDAARQAVADPDLWQLAAPSLAADLMMSETYAGRAASKVTCPVTAIAGSRDRGCGVVEMGRWAAHTIGGFEVAEVAGDHYFVDTAPDDLCALIEAAV
ncbi:thioesterase II family protein [Streptomyces sp. NPDC088785]|uniref:thioesterase II family protein n=1 Tax=Streptomyces sp. NPDC088785 TaxID=3365897 RepID=UPI0038088F3E